MSKKDKEIEDLKERNIGLQYEIELLNTRILQLVTKSQDLGDVPPVPKKKINWDKYAADISFDFWPPSAWWRLSYKPFRPGQYWQLCIGPFRMEFFA